MAGAPGPPCGGRLRAVGKVLIEHDSVGGQGVERRRVDPGIAVAAKIAEVQTTENHNNGFHTSRLYAVCERLAMRYNDGMAEIRLAPISFDRVVRAVEAVRQRLLRATNALDQARIPYAVVGGNAVAVWVARVDP